MNVIKNKNSLMIYIPAEVCKKLGIERHDELVYIIEDKRWILNKEI